MTSLTLEFRPRTFADIAGQPTVSTVLSMMVHRGEVPPALIFHGSRGTGKTSTARILAAALNCDGEQARPCLSCASCLSVRGGTSVDVIEVDAATNGRAEDIERLCSMLSYDVGSRNRVVILDEVHGLSRPAFDRLLKPIEEPLDRVTFVLVTTEIGQVPETIMSRCTDFRFKRISARSISERLLMIRDSKQMSVADDVLACIAERADGGMRDAIKLLDQADRAGAHTLEKFYELTGEGDFAPGLLAVMASGRLGELYDRVDQIVYDVGDPLLVTTRLVRCLRDILVIRAGGTTVTAQGEGLRHRQELARRLNDFQIAAAMRVLWDLQKIRGGNDARMVLDLAAVMCAEQFAPQRQPSAVNGNGHRQATIEDIEALARA